MLTKATATVFYFFLVAKLIGIYPEVNWAHVVILGFIASFFLILSSIIQFIKENS